METSGRPVNEYCNGSALAATEQLMPLGKMEASYLTIPAGFPCLKVTVAVVGVVAIVTDSTETERDR